MIARGLVRAATVFALVLVAGSCGLVGQSALTRANPQRGLGNEHLVPALPGTGAPVSPSRRASANAHVINGDAFVAQAGDNRAGDGGQHAYVIVPGGEDDLAYVQYTLGSVFDDRPVKWSVSIQPAKIVPGGEEELPMNLWIGLSNYSALAWEWHGPYQDMSQAQAAIDGLVLNNANSKGHKRYITADGTFSFVLLTKADAQFASAGNPEGLTGIEIASSTTDTLSPDDLNYNDTNAHYTAFSQGKIGSAARGRRSRSASALDPSQYVTLNWDHIYDNANGNHNEAKSYEIFRYRLGQTDGSGNLVPRINIGTRFPSNTTFVDPLDAPPGKGCVPGAVYTYYLRAISLGGESDLAVYPQQFRIPLLPPDNVTASLDTSAAGVTVSWDLIAGVKGYQILRAAGNDRAQAVALNIVASDQSSYIDTTATPGTYQYYWVKTVGEDATEAAADDTYSAFSLASGAGVEGGAQGLRSAVLTVSTVQALSGTGASSAPYILDYTQQYQFAAIDQDGNNLTALVGWSVDPAISARFAIATPGLLTDIFEFAGDFTATAKLTLDSHSWSGSAECRVPIS